ncbi:MAG: dephospho-CoA kinase [Candidatus Krumholzibacteria bacterium]|nr:dephospho-CoA kinase [Candidatus Krumholzibacteria bacterium]
MIRWVVTGPAGAGKSVFCGFLADRGAAVVDGDRLGHEILAREDVVSGIITEFGSGVVFDGSVDRSALARLVFADPVALEKLNRMTHGPLAASAGRRMDELDKEGRHRLAVLEAAVYFLLPPVSGIELVITVTASPSTRLSRMVGGGVLNPAEARSRIQAQRSLEDGWARADVVLVNDGPVSELEKAAEDLWSRLKD